MTTLHCLAPAKVNLFLHITGRREDGYHTLQTIFQLVDYCDELSFTLRTDGKIQLQDNTPNIPPEQNLIVRAARQLQTLTGTSLGVDITLHKRIPVGAGLGGGSSNAATTLVALNQLWSLHTTQSDLLSLGVSLGADIPFFIHGYTAWGEGIGEKLQSIELFDRWFVVLIPPCQIDTKEIYCDQELTRDTLPIKIHEFFMGYGHNDCETVVKRRYPEVATALDWLTQFAPARLTGTGSGIFAEFADQNAAQTVFAQIPKPLTGFVARSLNGSPLLG